MYFIVDSCMEEEDKKAVKLIGQFYIYGGISLEVGDELLCCNYICKYESHMMLLRGSYWLVLSPNIGWISIFSLYNL